MKKTKMTQRAWLALLMVCVLAVSLMTACGSSAAPAQTQTAPAQESADGAPAGDDLPDITVVLEKVQVLKELLDKDGEFMQIVREAAGDAERLIDDLVTQLSDENSNVCRTLGSFKEDATRYVEDLIAQLTNEDGSLYQAVRGVAATVTNEDGSLDFGAIAEMISILMDGDDESWDEDESLDGYVFLADEVYEASRAYYKEVNREFMDEGDYQFVSSSIVKNAILDENTVQQFGCFSQENFAVEGSDLKRVSAAADVYLITLAKNDDGSYTVIDAEHTEDGEDFHDSLLRLCEKIGASEEEYEEAAQSAELWMVVDLVAFMEEHPEITRMEYVGEMLTLEEMQEVEDTLLDEFFNGY